jgi:hypothetical protein
MTRRVQAYSLAPLVAGPAPDRGEGLEIISAIRILSTMNLNPSDHSAKALRLTEPRSGKERRTGCARMMKNVGGQ